MFKNVFEKILQQAYKASKNSDKVLITVGTVGWIISMFAQITAVKTNKSLSEDKKKILLAQETSDGLCNAGFYLGFTTILTRFVNDQVDKTKIFSADMLDKVNEVAKKTNFSIKEIVSNVCKDPGQVDEKYKSILREFSRTETENISNFKSGAGVIAAIIGSVLSVNIATPILRNKMGNYYQQKAKALDMKNNPIKTQPIHQPAKTLTPPTFTKNTTFATFSNITKI